MMLMGDEYAHTRYGNNNSYGHDTRLNNFQWEQVCSFSVSSMSSYLIQAIYLTEDVNSSSISWKQRGMATSGFSQN